MSTGKTQTFILRSLKWSSTSTDASNSEETGGQESGTVVDSKTEQHILITKKSLNVSSNSFVDSAVYNNTDLVLPDKILIFTIQNKFHWSTSHSCIGLLTFFVCLLNLN